MTALSNSFVLTNNQLSAGSSMKSMDRSLTKLSCGQNRVGNVHLFTSKRTLSVQAKYSDGRSNYTGLFVGGFVLGGLVVGAFGAIFAPQIYEALEKTDKEWLHKLPRFIHEEEEEDLEKQQQKLENQLEALALETYTYSQKSKKKRKDEDDVPVC